MNHRLLAEKYLNTDLQGRYITLEHIENTVSRIKNHFNIHIHGYSVLQKPVYSITAGTGKVKIFMWSQMHGNESTTTKAIFDFINFLQSDEPFADELKHKFTFIILPMVNPDGAEVYTRENANKVDLNRDAALLSQPESKILRQCFHSFKPDYAYNMHDQRTIFGVGNTGKPATVSFLAPSYNEARDINAVRQKAVNVIVAMNNVLQNYIPGQVGRFDDSYNSNCTGDTFQGLDVPTILFEAGHYPNDYNREITRKYLFIALLAGFKYIYENPDAVNKSTEYFDIPQNKTNFYDFVYKNVKINYENKQIITNFAAQYREIVFENTVKFVAVIEKIGNLDGFYGHIEYDCKGCQFKGSENNLEPVIGSKADFMILPNRIFNNGSEV